MRFEDRFQAGRILAAKLSAYRDNAEVVVLALPRGGVLVGYEVARALHAPLDVLVVRKIGLPGYSELAIGALASGDVENISDHAVWQYRVSPGEIEKVVAEEREELHRRERRYRGNSSFPDVRDKVVILVDDGLATGSTMSAAVTAVRQHQPKKIVVAIPVAAQDVCDLFLTRADQVVCAYSPFPFEAVGLWYLDFHQSTDDEIVALLEKARRELHPPCSGGL